ncbi:MAG: hypothetical protein PHD97_03305 [Bacteroidales bacterium]|nr:hypothetical protein [Bacteroidales bacterium]
MFKPINKIILLFLISASTANAQNFLYPFGRDNNIYIEHGFCVNNKNIHTTLKPYVELKTEVIDSIFTIEKKHDSLLLKNRKNKILWAKLKYDNLFAIKGEDYKFTIDPLFDFQVGTVLKGKTKYFTNSRGFLITGKIGKRLTFYSSYTENQAIFPDYLSDTIKSYKIDNSYYVVPGEGLAKPFKTNGFDFANSAGKISYSPFRFLNIQFGNGKHFIGDGYRSLLLSDNSYNYPFLQLTGEFWKIQYTSIYATFQEPLVSREYEMGFQKKYATFHFLSYNVNRRLNIGLFDAMIWKIVPKKAEYKIDYANPLIFYCPLQFSTLNSDNNAMIGITGKYKIAKKNIAYGQLIFDDNRFDTKYYGYYKNKYGYQLGIKFFDLFKVENLFFQTEFNAVRPYTYSHSVPVQNYSHYNQSLAHPLGANFYESVSILNYRFSDYLDKIILEWKLNYAMYGADSSNVNLGRNIFTSDTEFLHPYRNYIGQGVQTTLIYNEIRICYLINPRTNMRFELGFSARTEKTEFIRKQSTFFFFSFKTDILNHYFDF